jgi:hypothetical protein
VVYLQICCLACCTAVKHFFAQFTLHLLLASSTVGACGGLLDGLLDGFLGWLHVDDATVRVEVFCVEVSCVVIIRQAEDEMRFMSRS